MTGELPDIVAKAIKSRVAATLLLRDWAAVVCPPKCELHWVREKP